MQMSLPEEERKKKVSKLFSLGRSCHFPTLSFSYPEFRLFPRSVSWSLEIGELPTKRPEV